VILPGRPTNGLPDRERRPRETGGHHRRKKCLGRRRSRIVHSAISVQTGKGASGEERGDIMELIDNAKKKVFVNRIVNRLYSIGFSDEELPDKKKLVALATTEIMEAHSPDELAVMINKCRNGDKDAIKQFEIKTGISYGNL
jgi:hypothetical protein